MCFGANQKVLFVLLFSCLPGESKSHFPGTRAFSHSGTSETADAMKDAYTLFFSEDDVFSIQAECSSFSAGPPILG